MHKYIFHILIKCFLFTNIVTSRYMNIHVILDSTLCLVTKLFPISPVGDAVFLIRRCSVVYFSNFQTFIAYWLRVSALYYFDFEEA